MTALSNLTEQIASLTEQGLLRQRRLLESAQGAQVVVDGRAVLSFCSNDYLGLANHPDLAAAIVQALPAMGVGAGASHLVTGHHAAHHAFETAFAEFVHLPAALLFSTGYMANLLLSPPWLGVMARCSLINSIMLRLMMRRCCRGRNLAVMLMVI